MSPNPLLYSPVTFCIRYFAALGLLVSAVANGIPFFLRRIGIIDTSLYQADLATFCNLPIQGWWLPATCHYRRVLSELPLRVISFDPGRLYRITTLELFFKLSKFGFIILLIFLSILLILKYNAPFPSLCQLKPALSFLGFLFLAFIVDFHNTSAPLVLLATISWLSLPMLLLGGWLSHPIQLSRLADAVGLLILLQCPVGLLEAMRGLPTPFGPMASTLIAPNPVYPSRLSILFTLPNTLGVFAVVGLSFCLAFSHRRRFLPWLFVSVVLQILLARSATGLLVLLLLISFTVLQRILKSNASNLLLKLSLPAVALFSLVLALLPNMLARPDLWLSLEGRFWVLNHLFSSSSTLQIFFGHGLASSGNHLAQILAVNNPLHPLIAGWFRYSDLQPTDSLLALLLTQGGLLTAASFYGLLVWAFKHSPQARPFLLAVSLSSLTMSITEVFPLGLLLALTLNQALLNPSFRRSLLC